MILVFFWDFSELFFVGKVMDQVYGSHDYDCLLVHGGLVTLGRHDRSRAREVIVIARRERERVSEEVVRILTNGITWRRSCGDEHMTTLNRGSRWCSDGERVWVVRRRDWSWCGCSG
jgi:hypothetical protein